MPSRVWKYFSRSNDKLTATCNLCKQEFIYKGTISNLLNHLNGQHPKPETSEPVKQTPLSLFISRHKRGRSDKQITQAITNMIISNLLPLSVVEEDGFRHIMNIVAPDYNIPCQKTIRSRRKTKTEKESLIDSMKTVDAASIKTNTSTSSLTESYLTVTEHHIDASWDVKTNIPLTRSMPECHTGENIAERLKTTVKEFHLENKVITCVHDND